MRVAIVGAGAIGGTLAVHLLRAGIEVAVVDAAEETLNAARECGFGCRCVLACSCGLTTLEQRWTPDSAVSSLEDAGPVDVVFLCVKASILERVLPSLELGWRRNTVGVSFQNGIDTEERLSTVSGCDNTLRVVVNFSSRTNGQGDYEMNWIHPPSFIGALTRNGRRHAETVAEILNRSCLETMVVDDIKKYAFEKTALNAAMCPACALTGLTMAEVMTHSPTRSLVSALLREARTVGEAMGWIFENGLRDWLRYLENGGDHRTSMHADLQAGRPTEIQFMSGKICEHGLRLDIPTPVSHAMMWAVQGKERGFCSTPGDPV